VEALSDGVFAIAMTILVLNISVPTAETVSADRLLDALRQVGPQVIVYIISLVNLGVLWVGQHNQYHFIERADRWFLWINILYLLLISFMPLATARVIGLAHRRILGSAGAYTVALLLSLMVPVLSLALFLAVPLFNVLPFTLDRHFRAESK
jgi:uncharacterized membrane protein